MENIKIKNGWSSLNLNEFIELTNIVTADIPEHYKSVNLVSLLSGVSLDELESMPAHIFKKLSTQTEFISTPIPSVEMKNEYVINDHKYIVDADLTKITTAQYIDYQEYMKESGDYTKLMSLWLIPEGHKYGDGYDIKQVIYDMGCMNFLDFKAVSFFLQKQYAVLILITADCLEKNLKKMKTNKKDIDNMINLYHNMAYSLLYSSSLK